MERLRAQGRKEVSEEILFRAVHEQRSIEDEALRSSKRARRAANQRPNARLAVPAGAPAQASVSSIPVTPTSLPCPWRSSIAGCEVENEDDRQRLAGAGERKRIAYVRTERWITYPRAAAILDQMELLLDHPRNSRMPSLLIVGESGIGKTQLDLKFCRDRPARFDEKNLRTISPLVSWTWRGCQSPCVPRRKRSGA